MIFATRRITALALSAIATLTTTGIAEMVSKQEAIARNISFIYNPLSLTLKVESLELFAETGEVNRNLQTYLNLAGVDEQQKQLFREALTTPVTVDPVLLSRSLNTEEAERLLSYFGSVINVKGGSNGKYLIRGALITSALQPEGLKLINILRNLAVDVEIDIQRILRYTQQVETVLEGSAIYEQEVIRQAEIQSRQSLGINYNNLPDIRKQGNTPFAQETITLEDESRNRSYYAEIYYPTQTVENTPVVVISHGLSSRPEDFQARAEHLASYGYFVIMPQHIGSDIQQTEDFIKGYTGELFVREEFIDRPLDITHTLDELELLNQTRWRGNLDLENVGIFGHSFGGYTALTVGGATLDWPRLRERCSLDVGNLNTALILQCRALQLPQEDYQFRDERIKAVFAMNPVNGGILGPKGLNNLDTPLFIAAGSYDPATPFVFELAQTHPLLDINNVYLQLQEGQAHVDFSQLDAGISDLLNTVTNLTLPSPVLLNEYTHSMMLAFFEVHIRDNDNYAPYLEAGYAQYLSQGQEFKTYLVDEESIPALREVYRRFVDNNFDIIFSND
ncbi:alpha/beta hydrolase [Cyanobacterium stanieri]|nr:alpha/beta hydrolase [Cyanobacterium stanieri]